MSTAIGFLNEQFGRMLLGVACVLSVMLWMQNSGLSLPAIPDQDLKRSVVVELDKNALPTASPEKYFATGMAADYAGSTRCIFVAEKHVVQFSSVELEVPPATVMAPPQLLPDPGPSLEGSANLPRFGEEFPPMTLDKPDATKPGDPSKPGDPTKPGDTTKPADPLKKN